MGKQPKKSKKCTRLLKHMLSEAELLDYARSQSSALRDITQTEDQLASIKADYKAKLEALNNEMSLCARRIGDGFEMRETECITEFHTPEKGYKRTVRLDTGEEVDIVRMRPEEMQEELPLGDSTNEE